MKQGILASMLGCAVGVAALLPATSGVAAEAQVAAKPAADAIEEVIVTARRREENIQQVPIAVTVVSGEQLQAQGITNVFELANHVPNLIMNSSTTGTMSKGFTVGIRGVRATSFLLLDDPAVEVYYAETVIAHPWGVGDNFFDIQSVQVLKGPQGTLFGRNSTGGAVLIEPNKASIDEGFGGNAKLTLGDYNLQQFDGVVNIPLNDVAALRIAGEHKKRDGYTTNVLTGRKLDEVNNNALRVGFLIKPTRNVTSDTIIDYLDEDAAPTSVKFTAVFPPNGGFPFAGAPGVAALKTIVAEEQALGPWKTATPGGTNGPYDQMSPVHCDPSNPLYSGPLHYCRKDLMPKETLTNAGVLNNTQIEFDDFTIKNIIGYRSMKHRNEDSVNVNFIGTKTVFPPVGGQTDQQQKISQWQEEFQVLGKALDKRLDWQAGYFMMREWGSEHAFTYPGASAAWNVGQGTGVNLSKGLYGEGTYAITDTLKATLGVRKNWDHRDAAIFSTAGSGTVCQIRVGNTAALLPFGACRLNGDKGWQANTWTMALDDQITPDTSIYVTHRRGYHAGGFSLRSNRIAQFPYNPEFITDTEVGVKSDWSLFDRPLRTNFAIFNMDYVDQQVQVTNTGTVPTTTYIANAGKSRIYGAELEVTYRASKRAELSGFLSYVNPKYTQYSSQFAVGGPFFDLTYRPFGIPLWNAGLSVSYTLPLDADVGTITTRADATFRSKAIVDNSAAGLFAVPGAPPYAGFTQTPQAGYGFLNLRADWLRPFGNPVDLAVFVTNVTNAVYVQGGTSNQGLELQNFAPPRMWGVELSYRFGEGFKPKE